jgi:hypothetical protein
MLVFPQLESHTYPFQITREPPAATVSCLATRSWIFRSNRAATHLLWERVSSLLATHSIPSPTREKEVVPFHLSWFTAEYKR